MKMILTPHGFDQPYVDEILKQESILDKWSKCVELSFLKFTNNSKGSEIPNKTQELKRIIRKYVVDPSLLRNKIAHGQLSIALNSKNTNLNPSTTDQLATLDFVTIYVWFCINRQLTSIIEDLIESPDKAHHNNYYSKYQELNQFILKTSAWTTETKMTTISMKKPVVYNLRK